MFLLEASCALQGDVWSGLMVLLYESLLQKQQHCLHGFTPDISPHPQFKTVLCTLLHLASNSLLPADDELGGCIRK